MVKRKKDKTDILIEEMRKLNKSIKLQSNSTTLLSFVVIGIMFLQIGYTIFYNANFPVNWGGLILCTVSAVYFMIKGGLIVKERGDVNAQTPEN